MQMNEQSATRLEILSGPDTIELDSYAAATSEFVTYYPADILFVNFPQEIQFTNEDGEEIDPPEQLFHYRYTVIDFGDMPIVIMENVPRSGWSSKAGQEMEQIIQSLSFSQSHEENQ